jgi:hypothetical protein
MSRPVAIPGFKMKGNKVVRDERRLDASARRVSVPEVPNVSGLLGVGKSSAGRQRRDDAIDSVIDEIEDAALTASCARIATDDDAGLAPPAYIDDEPDITQHEWTELQREITIIIANMHSTHTASSRKSADIKLRELPHYFETDKGTAIEHSRRAIIAKSVYLRNLDKDQDKRASDVESEEALKELGSDMTAAAKRVAAKIGQEMLVSAA